MEKVLRWKTLAFPLVLALAVGVSACENPVEDDHEEHAIGLLIVNAQDQEVARVNIEASPSVTGQLSVPAGGSQTFQVFALAEDGDRIEIDGTEFGLQVTSPTEFADASVQGVSQLVISGKQAGTTVLTVGLLHEGHLDLSGDVALVITP